MSTLPDYWFCFGEDYASSRAHFLTAAKAANARLAHYVHPSAKGPDGGELSVDVALLGRKDAPRQFLALSGTHGLEGAAGSAVQTAWLLSGQAAALPDDVGIVLVHALNPYGWAHQSRTTENNVDLNRNFLATDTDYPANPHYAELHPWLIPQDWNAESLQALNAATDDFRKRHGPDAFFDTTARGQYTHPDGLVYGGVAREWSNLTLERIIHEHLAHARQVAFIDWHTGIGEYGQPFFLCFNDENSPEQQQAARWWGEDVVLNQRPHGLARPNYQGLVFRGVQQFLQGRPLAGAVVEFGTRGINLRAALYLDQWLRFKASGRPDQQRDAMLRADLVDAFVPVSSLWRRAVIDHGLRITRQAIDGLATW